MWEAFVRFTECDQTLTLNHRLNPVNRFKRNDLFDYSVLPWPNPIYPLRPFFASSVGFKLVYTAQFGAIDPTDSELVLVRFKLKS